MAWSLISHAQLSSVSGGTVGLTTTGADILFARAGYYNGINSISVSSALSGSFTPLTLYQNGNMASVIFYLKNPTVGSDTITITGASTFGNVQLMAFSGSDTTAPFDVENGASTASTVGTLAPGAITPTNDGELVISGVTTNGGGITYTNTSLTAVTDQQPYTSGNYEGGAAGYVALGAGTGGVSYTLNAWNWLGGASPDAASVAAFKAAGGGPTGKLFTPSNMDGLGSGGPFFSDRLAA